MEKSKLVFDVPKCPLCNKSHQYNVVVLRSSVMFGSPAVEMEKRARRLFTCPEKELDFEGVVILQDDPKNKIVSVTVEGAIKENR